MPVVELTCISCPLGCPLKVETDSSGKVLKVTGNTCKRGEEYGKKEVTNPTRTVTSTVRLLGGTAPVVSVRTQTDIPKEKIFQCMEEIRKAAAEAPVFSDHPDRQGICTDGLGVRFYAADLQTAPGVCGDGCIYPRGADPLGRSL